MLATVGDVEAFSRSDIAGGPDEATVTRLIELAGDVVKGYTGQDLEAVDDDEVVLRGDGSGRWVLPQRPVRAVSTVTTWAGTEVAEFDWTGWGSVGPPLTASGQWSTSAPYWADSPTLTVVYDHGYTVIPGDIVAVVCSMVTRQFSNPKGSRSESLGSWSETYTIPASGEPLNLSLSGSERAILAKYKRSVTSQLVVR